MQRNLLILLGCTFFVTVGLGFSVPLLDFALNRMGTSGTLIGLNASMPAFGTIYAIGSLSGGILHGTAMDAGE